MASINILSVKNGAEVGHLGGLKAIVRWQAIIRAVMPARTRNDEPILLGQHALAREGGAASEPSVQKNHRGASSKHIIFQAHPIRRTNAPQLGWHDLLLTHPIIITLQRKYQSGLLRGFAIRPTVRRTRRLVRVIFDGFAMSAYGPLVP